MFTTATGYSYMTSPLVIYGSLGVAIVLETIATSLLKVSEEFTRPVPTVLMVLGYMGAFYCLSITLRGMPVGIAYAIWSALGIVLVSAIGIVFFRQHLDTPAYIGLGLIIAGVVIINVFSETVRH